MNRNQIVSALMTVAVLFASGCLAGCAGMSAGAADTASTATYINARYALERSMYGDIAVTRAMVNQFVAANSQECRVIMVRAPRNQAFDDFALASLLAPVVVAARVNRDPVGQFGRDIANVGWSDDRLTQLAHGMANQEKAIASIIPPDLCSDIKIWAHDGYHNVPLAITRFLRASRVVAVSNETSKEVRRQPIKATRCMHVGPPSPRLGGNLVCTVVGPKERAGSEDEPSSSSELTDASIWRLLRQHESGKERSMAEKTEGLERKVTTELSILFAAASSRFSKVWMLR